MCCHNGHGAKQVLSALRSVDTSITEKDSAFWHKTLGSQGGGTAKADPDKALAAIDAAWVAATKNNKDWSAMAPQERLDAQGEFRSLREHVEDGQVTLTENQVLKLGSYVTKRKATPRIVRVGAVAAGLLVSMGVFSSSAANAEAATLNGPLAPISANLNNADAVHTPVGKNGMCATDFTLAKAGRTHKVTWQTKGGKVTTNHVMKKGAKACIFTGKDGTTATAAMSADGTLLSLPSNFPKNPTAQDIASLGLTRDSKVDPSLRLPQPSGKPLVAPKLADKIVPVGVYGTSVERVESGNSAGYEDVTVRWIEWDVQGGQGALTYRGANTAGGQQSIQSVALNPNGSVRILQGIPVSSANQLNGSNQYKIIGAVVPDYGQTAIPSSLSQNWQLGSQRATDVTGAGANVSVHGAWNPWWARADGSGGDDGYVNLDGSGNMVGTY